jgi:hypothetical protein
MDIELEKKMGTKGHLRLTFFKNDVRERLEASKNHALKVEELLKTELTDIECHHEHQVKELSEEQKAEYYEHHSDSYMELAKYIPSIQRKSELISICTILEHLLKDLCVLYKDSIQAPLEYSDIKANGDIDRARKYLIKVIGIAFPETSKNWEEIVIIQQIRNVFVHHDGVAKIGSPSIQYSQKSSFFDVVELAYIYENKKMARLEINEKFTIHCIDVYERFFEELFAVIQE